MKIVLRSAMLLLVLFLVSSSYRTLVAEESAQRQSTNSGANVWGSTPVRADNTTTPGVVVDTPPYVPGNAAQDWNKPERSLTDPFPPMYFETHDSSLKPRKVTAKDFYLNLVDDEQVYLNWLIVKFTEESQVRMSIGKPYSKSGVSLSQLESFLARHKDVTIEREDSYNTEDLLDFWEMNGEKNTGQDLANLNNFYLLHIPTNADPMGMIKEVISIDIVETAWYGPKSQLTCADIAPTTPDYLVNQTYQGSAPLGLDNHYAWLYYSAAGAGNPAAWCFDIEYDWTENHEDMAGDFQVLGGGDAGNQADHGDATVSIVAACNNGYGMTGGSYNVHPKGVCWGMQAGNFHQKWVAAFNIAAANLSAGESYWIEIHYPGPDPGYTCNTSCGNCGQFGYIPVEYWDDTFAAIQTHTANGVIVYEAAGNGQMNLDNTVYASRFDRGYRDSGAIIVGAAVPNSVAGECWSNYGSRVDLSGWGDSVYASGYGDLFNPNSDIRQRYTSGFSGTSSATPIVTAAGNDLQGIAQGKYGLTLTPAQMRTSLGVGATAYTGSHQVGNRPNMMGAINWIEPDLRPVTGSGWYSGFVPRDAAGATGASCPITTNLPGNTAGTYFNVFGHNTGDTRAPGSDEGGRVYTEQYIDALMIRWISWGWVGPNADFYYNNAGPDLVRGGRHSIQWTIDPDNDISEWNEANNSITEQFVWSPYQLGASNSYLERSTPPFKSWGNPVYVNGDGFRGTATNRWWLGCAILPQAENDIDLDCYADTYSSTSGFDTPVKVSTRGAGSLDMILVNGNTVGYQPSRLFQAVRYNDLSTSNYLIEGDESSAPISSAPYTNTSNLGANELMDIYEIYMTAGSQYFVGAINLTGGLNLDLGIYGPSGSYYAFSDYTWIANTAGVNGNEYVLVTPVTSGWYAAVVMKDNYTNYGISGMYTFDFESPGLANLQPSPAQPGWDAPVVVRNTADATTSNATFPTALQSGVSCYFNTSMENTGTAISPTGALNRVTLDNSPYISWASAFTLNPYAYFMTTNVNLGTIRGGRHTLGMALDTTNLIPESNETDNTWSEQYVWSPLPLVRDAALSRMSPPWKGIDSYPNSDGFSFTIPSNISSVVAVLPSSNSDYDMYDYSDYTGTTSGFSTALGVSSFGGSSTDFVIVPYRLGHNGFTHYAAVVNYNSTNNSFLVEADHTLGHIAATDTWTISNPDTIAISGILNIYEFPMTAGVPYVFSLNMVSGNADLALRLFRDSTTVQTPGMALAVADAGGLGEDETLTFTPTISDWYDLVVEKTNSSSYTYNAIYDLSAAPRRSPMPVSNLVSQFWTSPLGIRLTWNHVTVDSSGNPLSGRRYVIYRNASTDIVPLPADSIGGTTDSTFTDPNPFGAGINFYRVKVKSN